MEVGYSYLSLSKNRSADLPAYIGVANRRGRLLYHYCIHLWPSLWRITTSSISNPLNLARGHRSS